MPSTGAATVAFCLSWGRSGEPALAGNLQLGRRAATLANRQCESAEVVGRLPKSLSRAPGGEVCADNYARAPNGSEMGMGFLRKVGPDQHTTGTFEITDCGSMLLAARTEEHQQSD